MISALYAFTLRVAAMAVLCLLMECLIPDGRLKKTVKLCVGIVFVLCVAAPVAGCVQSDIADYLPAMADTAARADTGQTGQTYEELLGGYYRNSIENNE